MTMPDRVAALAATALSIVALALPPATVLAKPTWSDVAVTAGAATDEDQSPPISGRSSWG